MLLRHISSLVLCLVVSVSGRDSYNNHHHGSVLEMQVQADASMQELKAPSSTVDWSTYARALKDLSIQDNGRDSIFSRVSFAVHRSGEPESCGTVPPSIAALRQALLTLDDDVVDKYQTEGFLTQFLGSQLSAEGCATQDEPSGWPGLFGYCDMGPEFTVIQRDYHKLQRVAQGSLPCKFFTREGLRISSLKLLKELAEKKDQQQCAQLCKDQPEEPCDACRDRNIVLDLYAVPAGRMFMFGPSHVGELFILDHVKDSLGQSLVLQTLSLAPRVFDIYHFFSHAESEELVQKAIAETSETHRFHRSTTGTTSGSIYNKRTSENAWDVSGACAQKLKKRCFTALGIDEYVEEMSDGLQILRYNVTTAYTTHLDYLEDRGGKEDYDYDTGGKGGNRFATILLYFTDMEEGAGGETVFTKAYPPELAKEDRVPLDKAIQQLRASGEASMLKEGSWEEELTAKCRTRLAVRPNATRAVLFYSQYPNGTVDPFSLHGSCPVLKGTKIAANLWTWSAIRPEFEGGPRKREPDPNAPPEYIAAVFKNTGTDNRFDATTKLYYNEESFFGKLGPNDPPISVNTYETHVWNVKVRGKTLKTFVIGQEATQEFTV